MRRDSKTFQKMMHYIQHKFVITGHSLQQTIHHTISLVKRFGGTVYSHQWTLKEIKACRT